MADVLGQFYTGRKLRQGVSASSPSNEVGDTPNPVNPPGSNGVNLFTQLGDVINKDYVGKNGFVPVVINEKSLELQALPQFEEYRLISGGVVQWTGAGYVFNVSSAIYKIGGNLYQTDPTTKTLTTPDPTNNRIDVLAVDTSGAVVVIEGTPSATPVKPQIDPSTELELTSILVTAATTEPVLTEEVIYDENIEWTGSSSGTGTVAFNSTASPFQGTYSIETTSIQNGLKVRLTDGSDYDISTVQTIGFQIKLKSSLFAGRNIGLTFLDSSGNAISNKLILNINKSSTSYQFVGIALNSLTFTSSLVRSIEFDFIRVRGENVYSGFYLDIIKLEGGINPPITVGSFLGLTDTPSSYSGQAGKTVAVKSDESGLEFVTGGGGGLTGSGTANEIAYFTGATSLASLPVATYPSLTELSYLKGVTSGIQAQLNAKPTTFIGLTDTPANYTGSANKWARVNGGETALIFDTVSPYDLDQEGATDGQAILWNAATGRYKPGNVGLPSGGVESVTGDGVDNTDPANPVISYPTPSDIGAIGGTIASGQVAFGTGAGVIGGDSSFIWDSINNNLSIGDSGNTLFRIAKDGVSESGIEFFRGANIDTIIKSNSGENLIIGVDNANVFGGKQIVFQNKGVNTWVINTTGILQSNGAQTIQTSTGNLTLQGDGGNVGIGTSSPTSTLSTFENSIATGVGAGITIEQAGSGDSVLQFLLTGTRRWVLGIDNSDSDKFKISPTLDLGTINYFTIDTNGLVGIGTADPTSLLDVNGTARIRTISNLGVASTEVLVPSATGVVSKRTLAEFVSDLSPNFDDRYVRKDVADTKVGNLTFTNAAIINGHIDVNGSTSASAGTALNRFRNASAASGITQFFGTNGGSSRQHFAFYGSGDVEYISFGNGWVTSNVPTAYFRNPILVNGISFLDSSNIILNTTTGTKIGTATAQKLSFWNKTPIIQPTTGITGATRIGGGGATITDTDTFGGYTLAQIAQALINTGLLA